MLALHQALSNSCGLIVYLRALLYEYAVLFFYQLTKSCKMGQISYQHAVICKTHLYSSIGGVVHQFYFLSVAEDAEVPQGILTSSSIFFDRKICSVTSLTILYPYHWSMKLCTGLFSSAPSISFDALQLSLPGETCFKTCPSVY